MYGGQQKSPKGERHGEGVGGGSRVPGRGRGKLRGRGVEWGECGGVGWRSSGCKEWSLWGLHAWSLLETGTFVAIYQVTLAVQGNASACRTSPALGICTAQFQYPEKSGLSTLESDPADSRSAHYLCCTCLLLCNACMQFCVEHGICCCIAGITLAWWQL